jgi:hypothetical protein
LCRHNASLHHDAQGRQKGAGNTVRTCVNAKNSPLCLGVWQRELNLAVNAARPDQRRVQRLNAVGGHDNLQTRIMTKQQGPHRPVSDAGCEETTLAEQVKQCTLLIKVEGTTSQILVT